ncbi:MAG TPA: phenylalanine--tRNA ligase subunit beta, partial [Gammaproteobacteria bacterium]|nr:phenylalanine--tRNA ligase subunit beta [Gammaproteobacteria bacterium]
MKVSENWLREWVNPQISTEELNEQLTMLGLEVDDVIPAAGEFSQIVVGEIESIEKHPDADKLNVCQVNAGLEDMLQIVCGAPNARAGLKAPLALIGAVLPGNFKIKKSKLRGIESHGMLCSSVELGLSDDHSGLLELPIDAPVGKDIREYLKLNDTIIDVDLTPNRADCFCIKGIANDIACANELTLNYPEINEVPATHDEVIEVDLIAEKECPRYLCRVINGIDNTKTTPMWMQEKLRRSGIRSIHPVVDVTNYVMLELGQPMHGFDKAQINGSIIVKMANKGEKVTLLDGKEITLDDSYLMIADEKRHLAIAGVMGGLDSGVSENTTDIVLESAYFNPATIMGKSRDIGIHTESALRFERGVDPYLQQQAMQRATELIKQICGGEAGPIQEANSQQYIPQKDKIKLSKTKLRNILGFEVENDKVTKILQGLSMQVEFDSENWTVIPPSNRFDIEIAEDLVEEIVRMVGYDNMPSVDLITENNILLLPEEKITKNRVRTQLNQLGYQEAITYSFISEKQLKNYGFAENSIPLKNPLTEEFAIMRTSLLPGIMETANYNLRRQNNNV